MHRYTRSNSCRIVIPSISIASAGAAASINRHSIVTLGTKNPIVPRRPQARTVHAAQLACEPADFPGFPSGLPERIRRRDREADRGGKRGANGESESGVARQFGDIRHRPHLYAIQFKVTKPYEPGHSFIRTRNTYTRSSIHWVPTYGPTTKERGCRRTREKKKET